MKLLPLLLIICLDCGAQKKDTLTIGTEAGTGTMTFYPAINKTQEPNYDTVRVMLLYSDTAKWQKRYAVYFDSKEDTAKSIEWLEPNYDTRWQFGYEVREKIVPDYFMGPTGSFAEWPMKHISYLDDRKKVLPKNIIIWKCIKL